MNRLFTTLSAALLLSLSAVPAFADSSDDDSSSSSFSSTSSSSASSVSSNSDVVTDESYADATEEELKEDGIEVPPGWARMTREEKLRIIRNRQLHRIVHRLMERRMRHDENEDESNSSRPARMRGELPGKPRHSSDRLFEENDTEKPEGWDDWTIEEQKDYLEENDLRLPPGMLVRERVLNLLMNARDGDRYEAFSGSLLPKKKFTDDARIKHKDAVEFLQRRGIFGGNDDGSFNPNGSINRAETLKVLLEALGEDGDEDGIEQFSDVPRGAWFAKYIGKAKKLGIVKGYSDGSFKPGQTVNQAELLKIAFESFGIDLTGYAVTDLPEGIDTTAWYAVYLQYAIDNDLLDPEDVDPANGMTREMFAELIYRLIEQQEALDGDQ